MKAPKNLPGGSDCIGYAVTSVAGRDKKRDFLIVGICEEKAYGGMVYIADGQLRRIDAPKRKKLMHLKVHGPTDEAIIARLKDGVATDSEIRAAIHAALGHKEFYESKV